MTRRPAIIASVMQVLPLTLGPPAHQAHALSGAFIPDQHWAAGTYIDPESRRRCSLASVQLGYGDSPFSQF